MQSAFIHSLFLCIVLQWLDFSCNININDTNALSITLEYSGIMTVQNVFKLHHCWWHKYSWPPQQYDFFIKNRSFNFHFTFKAPEMTLEPKMSESLHGSWLCKMHANDVQIISAHVHGYDCIKLKNECEEYEGCVKLLWDKDLMQKERHHSKSV